MSTPINLFETISGILTNKGHKNPTKWQEGLNHQQISKLPYESQRKLINSHLRLVLGSVDEDTSRERFCLVDDVPFDNWVDLFDREIAGTMVRCGL
jgi:hypothetical protein